MSAVKKEGRSRVRALTAERYLDCLTNRTWKVDCDCSCAGWAWRAANVL